VQVDYGDRMVVWFAAALEPEPRYVPNLGQAMQAVKDRMPGDWSVNQGHQILRNVKDQWVFTSVANRLGFQTLGWKFWEREQENILQAASDWLRILGANQVKRIGFKTLTFVPMQMTHPEIVKLTFGSLAVEAEQLESACGELDDISVNFWGKKNGLKYVLSVLPQTAEQASRHIGQLGNLDHFMDTSWGDPQAQSFARHISADALTIDIDFGATEESTDRLTFFVKQAIATGDEIREKIITKVKGMTYREE
jgi:hypothetical protein